MRLLETVEKGLVLDLGCSTGLLANMLDADVSVIGVDVVAPDSKVAPARFAMSDGRFLPFPANAFDAVVLLEVIEHVPDGSEMALLADVSRVLRPGGTLLLSTPNSHPVATAADPAWWFDGHRHYGAAQLAEMLSDSGFSTVQMSTIGGAPSAAYLPIFIICNRLAVEIPFHESWRRAIERGFRQRGWHTIVALARTSRPGTSS